MANGDPVGDLVGQVEEGRNLASLLDPNYVPPATPVGMNPQWYRPFNPPPPRPPEVYETRPPLPGQAVSGPGFGMQPNTPATSSDETAGSILRNVLDEYGLGELYDQLYDDLRDQPDASITIRKVRQSDVYKQRFKGMERRKELGLQAISENEYMALERQYRQVMQAAGMPPGFYDDPDDFAEFIGQDRSANEIQSVVNVAVEASQQANPDTLNALEEFYGVTQGDIVAYYLDPQRATSVIEERRRLQTAGLAAAAERTVGQRLDIETAEELQREGVTRQAVQQQLRGREELMTQTIGEARMGRGDITASELAAAEFGLDREAAGRVSQARQQRAAAGAARSGAIVTGEGIATYQ